MTTAAEPTVAAEPGVGEWRNWTILLACVPGVMLGSVHAYSLGVMIGPLEQEFGWTRAEITSGPLILSVMALFLAPLMGALVDRVGPRRVGLVGVVVFCGTLALLSTATRSIASWWLLWMTMSVGAMSVMPAIWTAGVSSVFQRSRGLALAITLCGTGLGGAAVPVLANHVVNAFGWRGGYVALAIVFGTVVLPLVLAFMTSSSDRQRLADRAVGSPNARVPLAGVSATAGIYSARFAKLAAAAVISGYALTSLAINAVPVLVSHGFSRANAAAIASLVGVGAIVGRLSCGYLLDRVNAGRVAACSMMMPVVTGALLLAAPASTGAATAAFLILGLALGSELDACAYLVSRHFGLRSFGALFGLINGLLLFSNGLSPVVANFVYDLTKSYTPVLWGLIPACLLSAVLFLTLRPYPVFTDQGLEGHWPR